MSFILVPIDFSYTTSYRLSIVCSRTHRLATIHNVTDRRQTDASLSHKRDHTQYGRLKTVSRRSCVNC